MADTKQSTGARIVRGALAGAIGGIVASLVMDGFQTLVGPPGGGGEDEEPATAKAATTGPATTSPGRRRVCR